MLAVQAYHCVHRLLVHTAIFRGVSPPSSCSTAQSIPSVESLRALIGLSDVGPSTDSVVFREAAAATPGSGTAFLLSSSLPLVPAKLVAKVQARKNSSRTTCCWANVSMRWASQLILGFHGKTQYERCAIFAVVDLMLHHLCGNSRRIQPSASPVEAIIHVIGDHGGTKEWR